MWTCNFGFGRLLGLDLHYDNSKINDTYQKRVLDSTLVDLIHYKIKNKWKKFSRNVLSPN